MRWLLTSTVLTLPALALLLGNSAAAQAPAAAPAQATKSPVRIDVVVPVNAQVWFDGAATTQTGTYRQFVSPAVPENHRYIYEIRAVWTEAGRKVERTRKLSVYAGDRLVVDFAPNSSTAQVSRLPNGGVRAYYNTPALPAAAASALYPSLSNGYSPGSYGGYYPSYSGSTYSGGSYSGYSSGGYDSYRPSSSDPFSHSGQ